MYMFPQCSLSFIQITTGIVEIKVINIRHLKYFLVRAHKLVYSNLSNTCTKKHLSNIKEIKEKVMHNLLFAFIMSGSN